MNRFRTPSMLRLCICLGFVPTLVAADNWSNWRGPHGTGVADGSGYVERWSNDKHILWKAALPAAGGSTPAVWGERIMLTSPSGTDSNARNLAICFNRDGEKLWQQQLGRERVGKHKKGSGSNPSPVTDGELVYFYFKSGDLACLDLSGNVVWRRNLQRDFAKDTLWWDLGTSPVLTDQAVVIACVQSGPSYLAAFHKRSGELLWKVDRMLGAPEESNQTYSTPIVRRQGNQQQLIVLGADHVTCHDAATGMELWRVAGLNPTRNGYFRSIASPVLAGDVVVAPYARGDSLTAIRLDGSGDVTRSPVIWKSEAFSSDVPTPAAQDGRLYVLTDKGTVAALEVSTGKEIWSGSLPRNRNAYSASPVLADGRLYVVREDGTAFVLDVDKFFIRGMNKLDDTVVATPVFVDGSIFLRAANFLYCIGQ